MRYLLQGGAGRRCVSSGRSLWAGQRLALGLLSAPTDLKKAAADADADLDLQGHCGNGSDGDGDGDGDDDGDGPVCAMRALCSNHLLWHAQEKTPTTPLPTTA